METSKQQVTLHPPLPSPLSHTGIHFIFDRPERPAQLSEETIVAIAAALNEFLPPGDLFVDPSGALYSRMNSAQSQQVSLWYQAGLLSGIDRSTL